MKLEQQVSSLELSKTLKNLGVRQESAFYWQFPKPMESLPFNKRPFEERHDWFLTNSSDLEWCKEEMRCAAFTVAELYKIHCDLDPHACYRFPEGIEPEHLADHLAEEICQLLKK